MREVLETILNQGGKYITDLQLQPILSVILGIGVVVILLAPWAWPRRIFAGLMVAVLIASTLFWLLIAVETFTYDRMYGFFLVIFPGEMMGVPILLSVIGLALHRARRRREDAAA